MAHELSLERVETDDTYVIRGQSGREVSVFEAPAWLEEAYAATSGGVDVDELTPAYFAEIFPERGVGYEGTEVIFPNGYTEILEALQGDYEVELSRPLACVSASEAGVELEAVDGTVQTSDAVLVTVPLGC